LLGALVGVILRALDCDKRLQKWGFVVLAEWSPKEQPHLLLQQDRHLGPWWCWAGWSG